MPHNLFNTLQEFDLGNGKKGRFYSLPELEKQGVGPVSKLPVSVRIVLESVLRNCDGQKVKEDDVRALANWEPEAPRVARARTSSSLTFWPSQLRSTDSSTMRTLTGNFEIGPTPCFSSSGSE